MQELPTAWCWGEAWVREELSRRDRGLLNLGMISVRSRRPRVQAACKAGLRNGLTREEKSEALLQVAVYCGVPTGIDPTRIAREAIAKYEAESSAR